MPDLYRPSCGAEGEDFFDKFCRRCEHDRAFQEDRGPGCDICFRALAYDTDEPEYPQEWVYGADDRPTCTAFEPSAGGPQ